MTDTNAEAPATVTISRADYETLRAVAAAAVSASAALSGVARLQSTIDGGGLEIAVSDDVSSALERAEEILGPLLLPELMAAIDASGSPAAELVAEAAA